MYLTFLLTDDSCVIERTQENGICKLLKDCPEVISEKRNQRPYTQCEFVGRKELVCCPTPSSSTEASNRASNRSTIIGPDSRISERSILSVSEVKNVILQNIFAECNEYKSAVFERTLSKSVDEISEIVLDKCGVKSVSLISNGERAKVREFPHMALLGYTYGNDGPFWLCGGSLISDEYVLTAGHCLTVKLYGTPQIIRLGELDYNTDADETYPEDYPVSQIIPHPEYDAPIKYNDIGLIRLSRKVVLDPYKRPACLPTTFDNPEKTAIATGWGRTNVFSNSSSHLLKTHLEKFSHEECNETYVPDINRNLKDGIVDKTQLCAGSYNDKNNTCEADSGGPLQVLHPFEYCMYTIIGITSFGITCGTTGLPGVYTRVFPYIDWIENIVWGN